MLHNKLCTNWSMFDTHIDHMTFKTTQDGRLVKLLILIGIEIIALFGNFFFIVAVFHRKPITKQSRTFIYLGFVSITNLGAAIFVIPFPIVTLAAKEWILTSSVCYFSGLMNSFWLTLCVYSITLLSIHKYFSIVRPMQHRDDISYKSVAYRILATVILSIVVTIIPFIQNRVYFNPYTAQCAIKIDSVGYVVYIVLSTYVVPTIINVLVYSRIVVALKKHRRRLQFSSFFSPTLLNAQKEMMKTLYLAFLSFMCSWTPFFIYAILFVFKHESTSSKYFLVIAYMAGFSNSALNPLIFVFRNLRVRSWRSLRNKRIPKVALVPSLSHSQIDRRMSFFGSLQKRPIRRNKEKKQGTENLGFSKEQKDVRNNNQNEYFTEHENGQFKHNIFDNESPASGVVLTTFHKNDIEGKEVEIKFSSALELSYSNKNTDQISYLQTSSM